jgi:predicted nucleic-acid-binding Zn-ribbon protein
MMEALPKIGHEECGEASYSYVKRTQKGWYFYHCAVCGYTAFFQNPKVYACPHVDIKWKDCKKNLKFQTRWCPICRIREFQIKE